MMTTRDSSRRRSGLRSASGASSKETGVTRVRVELILAMLGETVQVHRGMSLCSACLIAKDVFQLG